MAEYSENQFLQRLNYYFPDNITQQISPKDIRDAFTDLVDSTQKVLESHTLISQNIKSLDVRQTSVGELTLTKTYLPYEAGEDNTAVGYSALNGNIFGKKNTAIGSYSASCNLDGDCNTAIGYGSLLGNVEGDGNVAIGSNSLYYNRRGNYNIAIGLGAGYYSNPDESYQFFLGAHSNACDSGCLEGSGTPLMRGDLQQLKLAIGTNTIHNYGTLQVSGDISPTNHRSYNIGNVNRSWNSINGVLIFPDEDTIQSKSNFLPYYQGLDIGSYNIRWDGFFRNIEASNTLRVTGDASFYSNAFIERDIEVTGNSYLHSDAYVGDDLFVTGSAYIGEDLFVTGNAYVRENFHATGDAFFHSNVDIRETLEVSGDAFFHSNVDINETLEVSGNSYLHLDAYVGDDIFITGNAFVKQDLSVTGNAFVKQDLYVTGNAFVEQDLYVTGNAFIEQDLYVTGNAFVEQDLYVTGNSFVRETFHATGDSFFHSNVDIRETLEVSGDAFFHSDVDIGETLEVSGDAAFHSNVDINETLEVSGDSYLHLDAYVGDNIFITGNAFVRNDLYATGDAYVGDNFYATGAAFIGQNLSVTGSAYIGGILSVTGAAYLRNHVYALRTVSIASDLIVTGSAFVKENFSVTGDAFVRRTFHATGDSFFRSDVDIAEILRVDGDAFLNSDVDVSGTLEVSGDGFFGKDLHVGKDLYVGRSITLRNKPIYMEGFYQDDILQPVNYCSPRSGVFVQKLFKDDGTCDWGDPVVVTNRDATLNISNGTYGQIMQYDNEWRPSWLGCEPEEIISVCSLYPLISDTSSYREILNSGSKSVLLSSVSGFFNPSISLYDKITSTMVKQKYAWYSCDSNCSFNGNLSNCVADNECYNVNALGTSDLVYTCPWGNKFMGMTFDGQSIPPGNSVNAISSGDFINFVNNELIPDWPLNAISGFLDQDAGVLMLGYFDRCGSMSGLVDALQRPELIQAIQDFQQRNGVVWVRGINTLDCPSGLADLNLALKLLNVESRFNNSNQEIAIDSVYKRQHPDDTLAASLSMSERTGKRDNYICVPEASEFYSIDNIGIAHNQYGSGVNAATTPIGGGGNLVNPVLIASGESYPNGPRLIGDGYSRSVFTMVYEVAVISGVGNFNSATDDCAIV